MLLAALPLTSASAAVESRSEENGSASIPIATTDSLSTIRGVVRDERGNPIVGAVIALWRDGMASVRQVTSGANGGFAARVLPGRYSLTAMADGFSVVSLSNVEVGRADDVAFRFNLIRTGSGNTLPEKRVDRNSSKYRIRANAARRTIYQNNEGAGEIITDDVAEIEQVDEARENEFLVDNSPSDSRSRKSQSAVETYFASSSNPNSSGYFGLNFATVQPVNDKLDFVFAGQTGFGEAPQRFETTARYKVNEQHRLSFNVGAGKLGTVELDDSSGAEDLGQISFQALDEWRVKDGVIVVLGVDYSRFVGASSASSISPRLGLQFETDARTRFNFAYTTQNEPRTWQQAAELEDSRVIFRQPNFESYVVADKQVAMPKLRRLEFGIERVIDNSSRVEAAAFFDATTARGLNLLQTPVEGFSENGENIFSNGIQNGSAQGLRLVYSRRLNGTFSTSLGYSFGRSQQLSNRGLTDPDSLLEEAFFQTFAAQVSTSLSTGTEVKTVLRFSPEATIFAIDPFAGRLAVYDPSLSVLVSQKLPSLGLPLRAKAIIDARNLFDFQTAANNGETSLLLNSSRRVLRGGIAVRF